MILFHRNCTSGFVESVGANKSLENALLLQQMGLKASTLHNVALCHAFVIVFTFANLVAVAQTSDRQNGRKESPLHFSPAHVSAGNGAGQESGAAPPSLDVLCPERLAQELAQSGIETLAVQSEGMNYSLRTWSEVVVAGVTGKPRYDRRDPVVTALSMAYRHSEWMSVPVIPIENPQVAALFGLDTTHRHRVSAASIMRHPAGQRYVLGYLTNGDAALQGLKPQLQKGVKRLAFRVATLLNVPHEFRIVPLGDAQGLLASPFIIEDPMLDPQATAQLERARLPDELVAAAVRLHAGLREGLAKGEVPPGELSQTVQEFEKLAQQIPGYPSKWKRELDRWYTVFHPFQRAAQVYWLAIAGFVVAIVALARQRRASEVEAGEGACGRVESSVSETKGAQVELIAGARPPRAMHEELRALAPWGRWSYWLAVVSLVVAAGFMLSGLVARYFLGGRIPVSNMYESITFTMAAFGVMGVMFETAYRRAWIGLVVALAGTFCMTMANSMPLHMRKVEPLVAVLNSVWLNYHVTSLLISYAAFLLSFLFAIGYFVSEFSGGKVAFLPRPDALEKLCYRSVLVGWPLLTLGIILGAVWANTAWGRYWSWDPKETWAFITWLSYTIYLHLRMVRGWRGRWSVAASMVGFLMVLITYFGVSYLPGLAGGLHSYAEPIAR